MTPSLDDDWGTETDPNDSREVLPACRGCPVHTRIPVLHRVEIHAACSDPWRPAPGYCRLLDRVATMGEAVRECLRLEGRVSLLINWRHFQRGDDLRVDEDGSPTTAERT
jgi:hypothetical protein